MASAGSGPHQRILALDFTKGVLVLFMVVYHWINYFIGTQSELLRYLRFLTPSFIFITGFLVSAIYLGRYDVNDTTVSRRLAYRGIKILGLFVLLNALISVLSIHPHDRNVLDPFSAHNLFSVYVIGNTAVAGVGKIASFFILIPISYLLLLSAGLLMMKTSLRGSEIVSFGVWAGRFDSATSVGHMFRGVWMLSLLGILVLHLNGLENSNLELLSIGLLGVVIGDGSLQKIDGFLNYPYMLGTAYFFYILAITIWNVVFPLQVVGVCLSLLIIYLVGARKGELGKIRKYMMLFGRYSLLAYVGQIAVIQLLSRVLPQFHLGTAQVGVSLLGAVGLTALIVEVVDRTRGRSAAIDKMYKAVFV